MSAGRWVLEATVLIPLLWMLGMGIAACAAEVREQSRHRGRWSAPTIGTPPSWNGPPPPDGAGMSQADWLRRRYVRGEIELDEFERGLDYEMGLSSVPPALTRTSELVEQARPNPKQAAPEERREMVRAFEKRAEQLDQQYQASLEAQNAWVLKTQDERHREHLERIGRGITQAFARVEELEKRRRL